MHQLLHLVIICRMWTWLGSQKLPHTVSDTGALCGHQYDSMHYHVTKEHSMADSVSVLCPQPVAVHFAASTLYLWIMFIYRHVAIPKQYQHKLSSWRPQPKFLENRERRVFTVCPVVCSPVHNDQARSHPPPPIPITMQHKKFSPSLWLYFSDRSRCPYKSTYNIPSTAWAPKALTHC
jgi:hypothetical protein